MDGITLLGFDGSKTINAFTCNINKPAERPGTHRDGDRPTSVDGLHPSGQPVCRVHCDRTDTVVTKMLLHFDNEVSPFIACSGQGNDDSVEDCRRRTGRKVKINNRSDDLDDGAFVHSKSSAWNTGGQDVITDKELTKTHQKKQGFGQSRL